MNSLSYPDRWWIGGYSPPVEDIQDAYVKGQVSDHALDNEIEWALSYPEPPAHVYLSGDEARIHPEMFTERTRALADDESTSVSIEREVAEYAFNDGRYHQKTVQHVIECHIDEVQAVFDSLIEEDDE